MNIQIFGKSKCFDTKKAERFFKERRIKYQLVDIAKYGLSGKEFDCVLTALNGVDNMIDWESKSEDILLLRYMDDQNAREDLVFINQKLLKTPIVRNGRKATVGYCPEVWSAWE